MYAATKYHGQALQFISKYYFQVKSTMEHENYRTIIIIVILMTSLPLTLTLAFSLFTVLHIFPMVLRLLKNRKVKVDPYYYEYHGIIPIDPTNECYYKKVVHLLPLTLTGLGIYIGLLVIHIFSIVRLLEYGNEVLSSYYKYLPIAHAVFSLLTVIIGSGLSVIFLVIRILRSKKDNNGNKEWSLMLTVTVISVNIFYLGCYFLPYMLLAFIHDPLQSTFTYLTVVFLTLCIYLIFLGISQLYKYCRIKKENRDGSDSKFKCAKCCDALLYSCMVWAMALSILMFLLLVTFFIESFDDFQKLQHLTPSLLIAILTVVLLQPSYKYLTKNLEDNNYNDNNTMEQAHDQNNTTRTV